MYRAIIYFTDGPVATRSYPTRARAIRYAEAARRASKRITGYALEEYVDGIGWCVSDEDTDEGPTVGDVGVW